MFMRERLFGGWLLILNLTVLEVGGVLMKFMGHMGWAFGRILGGVGESCLATRGIAPKFVSSMMFGVGLNLSSHLFRTCLTLPVLRTLLWRTIWSFLVPPISGILTFSKQLMMEMNHFTSLFTLLYSIRVRRGDDDRLRWIHSKRGLFDVKSYHKVLVPHGITHFPCRSI
jgi:hypothetical protein